MSSEDKSGTSSHLQPHSGTTDWSTHSDSHPGEINVSWLDQHLEIIPELIGGTGTGMHFETHPQDTYRSGSIDHFDINPTVIKGNSRTNPFETIPEVAGESESVSSSEDLFQVDTGFVNFNSHAQPSKDEEINVPNNNSESKAFDESPGLTSTSQFPQVANEFMVRDMPPTQFPPRQVMDRSEEYDPLRIPFAIFERSKSSTPQEWSAASNDSLFSIQLGNNSFSRDQFKSGELTKTDELIMFNPSPAIPEIGADIEVAEFEKRDAISGEVKNDENTPKETTAEVSQEKSSLVHVSWNPSHTSNHSNISSRSFAFPIKKCKRKKCAWPSCYRSNCSCKFCYSSCPGCYFRWPSCYCSNCSWAFCYCWNCSLFRWCCHSSTTLTDRVKSVSAKPDIAEKQRKKLPPPEVIPKSSSSCCWFSCLSCHPCSRSCSWFRCSRPCSWFLCCSCGCCCRQ